MRLGERLARKLDAPAYERINALRDNYRASHGEILTLRAELADSRAELSRQKSRNASAYDVLTSTTRSGVQRRLDAAKAALEGTAG